MFVFITYNELPCHYFALLQAIPPDVHLQLLKYCCSKQALAEKALHSYQTKLAAKEAELAEKIAELAVKDAMLLRVQQHECREGAEPALH